MQRAFAGLQPSGGRGCNPHLTDCAWTGEARITPETIASTIINSNFLNTACLPCAVSVQPGAARRAAAGQRRTCRFVQKRPRQGYFLVSLEDGLNGVKPIAAAAAFQKGDGFRGACHRAGHSGPDPLALPTYKLLRSLESLSRLRTVNPRSVMCGTADAGM